MITFLDGPAAGVANGLLLRRAPEFLRVVHNTARNTWDALDQLDATPQDDETVHVYRLEGDVAWIHINRDRRHGGSGTFVAAAYFYYGQQPEPEFARETAKWRGWATTMLRAEQLGYLTSKGKATRTSGEQS